jgi:hypothetical protein
MDPLVLSSLIGGGAVNLVIWGALLYLVLRDKRRLVRPAAGRRLVHDERFSPMFGRPITDWERVFIWKPVRTVDRGMVMPMQYVWRRRIAKYSFLDGGADFWFQER